MSLLLVAQTPSIALYHDSAHNWLYADWQGHVTLPIVQESCALIARHFLRGNYTKVLNDNTNVLSLSADVSPWLAREFLPYIVIGGIRCIAWVYSPNISTQCYTDVALLDLHTPVVALFTDLATACAWLQAAQFTLSAAAAPLPDPQQHLLAMKAHLGPTWLVEALEQHLATWPAPETA